MQYIPEMRGPIVMILWCLIGIACLIVSFVYRGLSEFPILDITGGIAAILLLVGAIGLAIRVLIYCQEVGRLRAERDRILRGEGCAKCACGTYSKSAC